MPAEGRSRVVCQYEYSKDMMQPDPSPAEPSRDPARDRISRAVDIAIASVALLLLSPVMLIIALAVIAESGRPVFFGQTRLGLGGKTFRIHKFRKFRTRDEVAGPLLTMRNDARMSRVGRFLERTKLDELPQFYNVLKGDMAIVGPRPDSEVAFDLLTGEYCALLNHKPGIFGPAQVAFRNAGTLYPPNVHPHTFYLEQVFPVKARLDLSYYPHRTLLRDLLWIVRGVLVVFGLYPTLQALPGNPEVRMPHATGRPAGPGAGDRVATEPGAA